MPGWHELTANLQREGKLRMIGIIQEQHPDRCRLFMQWKHMNWPIMVDPLNLLGVTAVPITLFVDEAGIIRHVRPQPADLETFLNASPAEGPSPQKAARPNIESLERFGENGAAGASIDLADALVLWGDSSRLGQSIDAYRHALAIVPENGEAHFRLGVAYRKRFDSSHRQPNDFRNAIEHWSRALAINPNQYIWRRRIQQYGPRLDKPYPFYDWIHTARAEISSRGETPISLIAEPSGAEIAAPAKDLGLKNGSIPEPDPQGRIHRDDRPLIHIEPVVVPGTAGSSSTAARIHLLFRPNRSVQAHWNNESDPLEVWIDPPEGIAVTSRHYTHPNGREAVSDEPREIEFEVGGSDARAPEPATIRGYALYYVCEGADGTCLYRRQDFSIPILKQP